ncbi:MAG: hypothetical protein AB8U25_06745 [Rickettsiales endosymbiont of Dermacentor nuttalli]
MESINKDLKKLQKHHAKDAKTFTRLCKDLWNEIKEALTDINLNKETHHAKSRVKKAFKNFRRKTEDISSDLNEELNKFSSKLGNLFDNIADNLSKNTKINHTEKYKT